MADPERAEAEPIQKVRLATSTRKLMKTIIETSAAAP